VLDEATKLRDEWTKMVGYNNMNINYLFRVVSFSGYFIHLKNWIEEAQNVSLTDEQLRELPDSVDVNWRFDAVINYVMYRKDVFIMR